MLAQQDAFAPFIWVAVQSVLNVMGDLLLIQHFKQGLTGAAWATVVSQLVGTIGLIWMLTFRGQVSDFAQAEVCTRSHSMTFHNLRSCLIVRSAAVLCFSFAPLLENHSNLSK